MNTLDVLIAARKLIEKPENWWNGRIAKGSYCALLAVDAACQHGGLTEERDYEIGPAFGFERCTNHLPRFNDTHTHAEVLALFDKAIASERSKLHDFTPQVREIIDGALAGAAVEERI